ncbi:hypothetical protein [Pseudoxanthobacter sp.]|uniref:hypothetical protein n=1 Tax=Pseudoxanthobacter sp. TaxID=1925742 RepID=UPI002FDF3486
MTEETSSSGPVRPDIPAPQPAAEPRVLRHNIPTEPPRIAASAPPLEPRPIPPEHRRFARPGAEPTTEPRLFPAAPVVHADPIATDSALGDVAPAPVAAPSAAASGAPRLPTAASLDALQRHMGRSVEDFSSPAGGIAPVIAEADRAVGRRRRGLGGTLLVGTLGISALVGGWLWLTGKPAVHAVSVSSGDSWQTVDIGGVLGKGGQAVISADAPFRVRVDGKVYSITEAEGVVLPLSGSSRVEVRAIGREASITVSPVR